MSGLAESAAVRRINEQCGDIYRHKTSGIRYRVAYSADDTHELHPISGPCKYATDEELGNAEVWEKLP